MMVVLFLVLAFLVGYFCGSVSFSRIFCRLFSGKDITEIGSKNPGATNMLRTRGVKEAFLTLACDCLKCGAPALAAFFIFKHFYCGYENLAYFLLAFGAVIGHIFPIFYHFKGGKGVSCTFGMFLFHPVFWWWAMVIFVCGFVTSLFYKYLSVINLTAMTTLTITATVYFSFELEIKFLIPIIVILWVILGLLLFTHRGNIRRLIRGEENKTDMLAKLKESIEKRKTVKQEKFAATVATEETTNAGETATDEVAEEKKEDALEDVADKQVEEKLNKETTELTSKTKGKNSNDD